MRRLGSQNNMYIIYIIGNAFANAVSLFPDCTKEEQKRQLMGIPL